MVVGLNAPQGRDYNFDSIEKRDKEKHVWLSAMKVLGIKEPESYITESEFEVS